MMTYYGGRRLILTTPNDRDVDDDDENHYVVVTTSMMPNTILPSTKGPKYSAASASASSTTAAAAAIHDAYSSDVDFGTMTAIVLAMALFAGLGALPLYVAKIDAKWEGPGLAIACGMMLAAAFDLLEDGSNGNALGTTLPYLGNAGSHKVALLIGALFGVFTMSAVKRFFAGDGDDEDDEDDEDDAARQIVKALNAAGMAPQKQEQAAVPASPRKELSKIRQVQCMLYLLVCLCIHSGAEGISMGVAFKADSGWHQGVRVAFSMGLHNACEGLAIALVLTSSGFSNAAGVFWSIITHLPQVPGAMLFYVGAKHLAAWLPVLLGWAGASILYIVFTDMLPTAADNIAQNNSRGSDPRLRSGMYVLFGIAITGLIEIAQDVRLVETSA